MKKKPLSNDVEASELDAPVRAALAAWGHGQMTPAQQALVLRWIVEDLSGSLTPLPMSLEPHQYAYTAGQQRVGKVLLKLSGARIGVSVKEESHDD